MFTKKNNLILLGIICCFCYLNTSFGFLEVTEKYDDGTGRINTLSWAIIKAYKATPKVLTTIKIMVNDISVTGKLPDIKSPVIIASTTNTTKIHLNPGADYRIFNVKKAEDGFIPNISLQNLHLVGGNSSDFGGGIFNEANLRLQSCTVSNCIARSGGAIHNAETGKLNIYACTVSNNISYMNGGGINGTGKIEVNNSTFKDNYAAYKGGGFYFFPSGYDNELTINDKTRFENNQALYGGGLFAEGMYQRQQTSTVKINNSLFAKNSAGFADLSEGGGICLNKIGEVSIEDSKITNNYSHCDGAGICVLGCHKVTLLRTEIFHNTAQYKRGGGLFLSYNFVPSSGYNPGFHAEETEVNYNVANYFVYPVHSGGGAYWSYYAPGEVYELGYYGNTAIYGDQKIPNEYYRHDLNISDSHRQL